tara:strand:- start:15 stop:653 length:639 start_codon:yes stop_codon:yes gene_type:complete
MGKDISSSDISYQSNLVISENVDILSTQISLETDSKLIGRSNKVLQLNVYSDNSNFKFVSLLKHNKRLDNLKVNLEDGSVIESKEIFSEDTLHDDQYNKWISMKKNIIFYNELDKSIANGDMIEYLTDKTDDVFNYLFKSEVKSVERIENIQDLIDYTNFKMVRSIISNLKSNMNSNSKNNMLFGSNLPSPQYPILGRQHSIAHVNFPNDFE